MMRFLRHSYTAIILGFLYLPIFILIVFSFNASKSRAVWEGFTLRWYEELLESEAILDALSYTLSVAVISSLAATARVRNVHLENVTIHAAESGSFKHIRAGGRQFLFLGPEDLHKCVVILLNIVHCYSCCYYSSGSSEAGWPHHSHQHAPCWCADASYVRPEPVAAVAAVHASHHAHDVSLPYSSS